MKWPVLAVALLACGRASEPAKHRPVAIDAARPVDARLADAAAPPPLPTSTIASWSTKPIPQPSPACITAGDRFIQYADLEGPGALRMCLWWNVAKSPADVGCWRIELATGVYTAQAGVWFSQSQPMRVGDGGGLAVPAPALTARWNDGHLELCRGAACRATALAMPADPIIVEAVFDAHGQLAAIPLARGPARVATVDVASGATIATFGLATRRGRVDLLGFVGPSLMLTDCDDANTCAWDLYDPRTGTRLAAVGGSHPLANGGTAVAVDDHRFAAIADTRLVIQDATTGNVTARLDVPRRAHLHADDVVFLADHQLVIAQPDGRVALVDPDSATITRTIAPPRCTH